MKQFDFSTTLPDWPALRQNIFAPISNAFTQEEHLLPVSELELIGSFVQGLSMVVLDRARPVGHTRLLQLTTDASDDGAWYELGSTWIHPEYTGQKLCTRMYQYFLPKHEQKNILMTTTNPAMLAVGQKMGFIRVPRKALPKKVWQASCTCSHTKTGSQQNARCMLADGESQHCFLKGACWFRITEQTAKRTRIGIV